MKKIKLLFHTENYSYGGLEGFLFSLLNNMDSSKYEITLFYNNSLNFEQRLKRNVTRKLNQGENMINLMRQKR